MLLRRGAVLLLSIAFFTSCIGVKTEIVVKKDLSSIVNTEWTLSKELFAMGALGGNASFPPVPIGKRDLERTAARIEGLSLKSYQEKETDDSIVISAVLSFDNLEALSAYLKESGGGGNFSYKKENGKNTLDFTFDIPQDGIDPLTLELMAESFSGYDFDFSIEFPGGKKTFSSPMSKLLTGEKNGSINISF